MATRITLYEAGGDAVFTEVDGKTKRTKDGADYRTINPLGQVPALRTDAGEIVTENAAILPYVARQFPASGLAPQGGMEAVRLDQWLSFIGTEVHKALFTPLLDPAAPAEAKAYALAKGRPRLAVLADHLLYREYLLDHFSVADAYLVAVLNWTLAVSIDLKEWPSLVAYLTRMRERPSVARAMREERPLYAAEQARHKTA